MKPDIWTFLFQLINFIVLLFILKRILYKPIREIMERRRGIIAKSIESAENTNREALSLKEKHRKELEDLGEKKAAMIEKMEEEVSEEREKLLSAAEKDAASVIEKERSLFNADKARFEAEFKEKAIDMVSVFAAGMLKDIADEEMHKAVCRKFLNELEGKISGIILPEGRTGGITIGLISAYPLSEDDLGKLRIAMESQLSKKIEVNPATDRSLIAGVKIKIGDKVFDSSISGQIDALKQKLKGQ